MDKQNITESRGFAVIAKPVGSRCNMQCRYCYYLDKGQFSTHKKQSRMSFGLLEKLIRQTIEANPGPVVSFTWHGGEPMLAGLEFFRQVVALQKKYLPAGWQAWNNLQTNGLLLNREWCRFLRENRFDVGLSIDGDQLTHDENRLDLGGKGTYERVRRAVGMLKEVGIQPDLLCTVTASTARDPLAVYRALRDLDTGWIQFIPVIVQDENGDVLPISTTPEGYGRLLITAFDEWITHDMGQTDVQIIAETAKIWAGGEASVCTMAPTCGRVLIAEEDGSVYACDHFVDHEHRLGNLQTARLGTMAESEAQLAFGRSKRELLTAQCRACPWLDCCQGGCLKDRFALSDDGEVGQYYLCDGLRQFFAHADRPLHRVMELSRERKRPREIMEIIRREFYPELNT